MVEKAPPEKEITSNEVEDCDLNVDELKRSSVRGGAVTMVSQLIGVGIQLLSTVVLARMLSPNDYGIMAMVVAVTGFAGLFRDLGLSSAAIQKKDLTHRQLSNFFWLNVSMGALLTIVVAVCSPLVAWFYGRQELAAVTLTLSAGFLIGSLGSQQGALLVRKMWFGRNAFATLSGSIVTLLISILLAWAGYSYWALVWGALAGSTVTSILLFVVSPFRPGLPTRGAGIREMVKFGANVTGYDLVNYFARNADNMAIGRYWGAGSLGYYSRAYSLLMLPIVTIRAPITAVGFTAMSRLQEQPEAYRNYFQKICRVLAVTSMPLAAFLFVVSGPLIEIALGPQWHEVVPIFEVLAAVALIQPTLTLWGMLLLSRGQGRRYFHLGMVNSAASVAGILIGLTYGPMGVAVGYAISIYAMAYPSLKWALHGNPVSAMDFVNSAGRAFASSLIAAGCGRLISGVLTAVPPVAEASILGLIFFLIYMVVMRLLPGGRAEIEIILHFARALYHRRQD
jgi:PST family polysaccharide transporter